MTRKHIFSFALSLALAPTLAACGDEASVVGGTPVVTGGGLGSAGAGGGNAGAAGASGEAACVETPTAPEEYLIRCTSSACRPFDNAGRLGLYRAGEPLPEVP